MAEIIARNGRPKKCITRRKSERGVEAEVGARKESEVGAENLDTRKRKVKIRKAKRKGGEGVAVVVVTVTVAVMVTQLRRKQLRRKI